MPMRTIDVAKAFTGQYLINTLLQLGAIYRKSRESRLNGLLLSVDRTPR